MNLQNYYNEEFSDSKSKFTLKSIRKNSKNALFLDRDGVLIEDVHYIDTPHKVLLCKNVHKFLKVAREKGYSFIIITNQSSVSRSIISYERYRSITNRLLSLLPQDLYPELILSSFHLPKNENNLPDFNWRKPGTGMIDYAAKWGNFEKKSSVIVGDKLTDLIAGYESGIGRLIYKKSSLHMHESSLIRNWSIKNKILYEEIKELNSKIL